MEYPERCYLNDSLISLPKGYRWLKVGEIVLKGDFVQTPHNDFLKVSPKDKVFKGKPVEDIPICRLLERSRKAKRSSC